VVVKCVDRGACVMSNLTYDTFVSKRLIWLHGEIKTPPFSKEARMKTGSLIRLVQDKEVLSLPQSRPMPTIGPRCHELRVNDQDNTWRIVYRVDEDVVIIADVFSKKTQTTPNQVIDTCRARLKRYDLDKKVSKP
jgi:phage-related protein